MKSDPANVEGQRIETKTKKTKGSNILSNNRIILGCALLLALGFSQTATAQSPFSEDGLPLVCWTLPSLMARFQENHVSRPLRSHKDASANRRAYEKRLDPSKVLLLESEHQALRTFLNELVKKVEMGQCEQLTKLRTMQQGWHEEMGAFVEAYLNDPELEINKDIVLQVDPDKRERPKTKEDRAERFGKNSFNSS